jgi:hypothetical protein
VDIATDKNRAVNTSTMGDAINEAILKR